MRFLVSKGRFPAQLGSTLRFQAADDRDLRHALPFGEHNFRVGIKRPVIERGMIFPVVRIGERYTDELHAAALTACDKTAARGLCVTGLSAVHAAAAPEQFVVVHIRHSVDAAAPHGKDFREHAVLQRCGHNTAEIVRGGAVSVGVQSVRVDKVRRREPKLFRFPVHPIDERLAAERTGNGKRRVVAGGEQQSFQKLAKRIALPRAEIHGGALHRRPLAAHCDNMLRRSKLKRGERRHKLRRAGDQHRHIGVLFRQDRAGARMEHDHRLRRGIRRCRSRKCRDREHGRCNQEQQYCFFHK